ncbi:hypothetical protein NDK50_21290 [Paraburkholderia bryophila]|uniref:hypothetical protein n=1 Tax=Paraburkholderia bryophila TaxID=420952 RepID=UPI00234AB1BC|nr:hypothetical protein [Paraburkholderia bryophila]WCM23410.1 hypothetical protein NDK50_21290 [Paraburkholderia bryophila]
MLRNFESEIVVEIVTEDAALVTKDAALVTKDAALVAKDAAVVAKDAAVVAKDAAVMAKDATVATKDAALVTKVRGCGQGTLFERRALLACQLRRSGDAFSADALSWPVRRKAPRCFLAAGRLPHDHFARR